MLKFQERFGPIRAAVYIDGFNLYHRIHDTKKGHLKWQNLWRLSELICQRHGTHLVKVCFCTAVPEEPADVRQRHITYNNALRSAGVSIVLGHHMIDPNTGKRTDKQSDINLALSLIRDAHDGIYDCAYILSADSDQAATARTLKDWFPEKYLIGIAPPAQGVPDKIKSLADAHFALVEADIERCIFHDRSSTFRGNRYQDPSHTIHLKDGCIPTSVEPKAKLDQYPNRMAFHRAACATRGSSRVGFRRSPAAYRTCGRSACPSPPWSSRPSRRKATARPCRLPFGFCTNGVFSISFV